MWVSDYLFESWIQKVMNPAKKGKDLVYFNFGGPLEEPELLPIWKVFVVFALEDSYPEVMAFLD